MADSDVLHVAGAVTAADGQTPARLLDTPDGTIGVTVGTGRSNRSSPDGPFVIVSNASGRPLTLWLNGHDGPAQLEPGDTTFRLRIVDRFATLSLQAAPSGVTFLRRDPSVPVADAMAAISLVLSAEAVSAGTIEFIGQLFARSVA